MRRRETASILPVLFILIFASEVASQNKQYTIAVWDKQSDPLYQKVVQIKDDSVTPFVNGLVKSIDNKIVMEGKQDKHLFQFGDSSDYYYAYIGDTIVRNTIKLPYRFSDLQPNLLYYRFTDSFGIQKIMTDSVLAGRWIKYSVLKNHVNNEGEKSVKNFRVDGALSYLNDSVSYGWIQIYKNGVKKEVYGFQGLGREKILSDICVDGDFSKSSSICIKFQNGKVKDIMKNDSVPYIKFDAMGRIIGGTLLR